MGKNNKRIIKYGIYEFIFILFLIITMINKKRINSFANIFGSFFGLQNVGILLYYLCLALIVSYNSVLLIRFLFFKEKEELNLRIEKIFDIPSFIIKCTTVILFIMIFITTPCTIVGQSMYSTLDSNDKVLSFNLFINPKDGDIIVFDAEEYNSDESFYIKRVVAVEGDTIRYDINNCDLYINDKIEEKISYDSYRVIRESIDISATDCYEFIVPKNKILVFGDNRNNSIDSRSFGFIDKSSVFGKVYLSLIPFKFL
ncbi:MAG: signal peptidase I [Anaeroplasma sp.]